jgi:response regulator RpfG family c-di-GMP phosphodiesterase
MPASHMYSKVLIVDDELEIVNALKELLLEEQYVVETAGDGEDALSKVEDFNPHCILLDMRMPYLNGVDALKMIKVRQPEAEVIMVTAVTNIKTAEECMHNGAFGYITKPIDLDHLLKEIHLALEHRKKSLDEKGKEKEREAGQGKLESRAHLLNKELFHALRFPLQLTEYFNHEFACHSKNVSWLCENIAKELKIKPLEPFNLAGLYHDIGKLSFPRGLVNRSPSEWTANEKHVFEQFPIYGQELVQFHFRLKGLGSVIKHQCENFDGTGFPDRLSGDEIPLESRVIAIANAFDENLTPEQSMQIELEIKNGIHALEAVNKKSGTFFDPIVVEALERFIKNYSIPREEMVDLTRLDEGMRVSRDLFTEGGKVVVSKGMTLDSALIKKVRDIHRIDPITDSVHIYPPT